MDTSYLQNNDNTLPIDWSAYFSAEIFDEFMITNINGTSIHAGLSITETIAQTTLSSYKNIKVDIKWYPTFNG